MNFSDRDVDCDGFLAGRDFLLVAAMMELAFDFDVSAFGEFRGGFRQLAPEHDTVPLGAAIVRARSFFQLLLVASGKLVTAVPLEL